MSFIKRNINFIYIFILAIHVVLLSHYFIGSLGITKPTYFYFKSVVLYFNDNKKLELIEYVVTILFVGIYFLLIVFGNRFLTSKVKKYSSCILLKILNLDNKILSRLTLTLLLISPLIILVVGKSFDAKFILQLLNIFGLLIIPFYRYFINIYENLIYRTRINKLYVKKSILKNKYLFLFVLFCGYFQLLYIFYDPIVNKPKIINEYFNIPEKTILSNNAIVNNTVYFNQIVSSPITKRSDIDRNDTQDNCFYSSPKQLNIFMPDSDSNTLFYNPAKNLICINGMFALKYFNDANNTQLYDILQQNQEKIQKNKRVSLGSDNNEFLGINSYELHWQVLSRFMIHHNSFMFVPISEMNLGKDINAINAQYGLGSTFVYEKILSFFNMLSFDGVLKLNYIWYYLYFFMFCVVVYLITKSISWTSLVFILSLIVINYRGYDFLLLPPGESPFRHFFDIFIVYCLFLYGKNKQIIYFFLSLFLGILSIFLNPQIGVMIFISALIAGLFFTFYEKQSVKTNILFSIFFSLIALIFFVYSSSANDLAIYYLDGVIGFKIKFSQMFFIFVCIILSYLVLFYIIKNKVTSNYVYLIFLLVYSQALIVYVVWHFDSNGFKSRSFIYILTVALLLFQVRNGYLTVIWKERIRNFLLIVISFIYIDSVRYLYFSKRNYDKIFLNHIIYNWNMTKANIISTMNPKYFEKSVELITKYSGSVNGIYMISEYDNLLPFLANKYSLMPFFDLKWYSITPKELQKCIDLLVEKHPEYIFVDTNIDRNLNNEIIDSNFKSIGELNKESIWRVHRLKLLNEIFESVKKDYDLLEITPMISVYKRKESDEKN